MIGCKCHQGRQWVYVECLLVVVKAVCSKEPLLWLLQENKKFQMMVKNLNSNLPICFFFISSKTVANTSLDATMLNWRYLLARCQSSASAEQRLLCWRRTSGIVPWISRNRLINLMFVLKSKARVIDEHKWCFEWRSLNWTIGAERETSAAMRLPNSPRM